MIQTSSVQAKERVVVIGNLCCVSALDRLQNSDLGRLGGEIRGVSSSECIQVGNRGRVYSNIGGLTRYNRTEKR